MKKIIAFILALVMCLPLCACSPESEETNKTTRIFKSNFDQYFDVDVWAHDINETTKGSGIWKEYVDTCTLTISIKPKMEMRIEGELGVEFAVGPFQWFYTSNSSYFETDADGEKIKKKRSGKNDDYIVKVNLYGDGSATINLSCVRESVLSNLDNLPYADIYNVYGSGSVIY